MAEKNKLRVFVRGDTTDLTGNRATQTTTKKGDGSPAVAGHLNYEYEDGQCHVSAASFTCFTALVTAASPQRGSSSPPSGAPLSTKVFSCANYTSLAGRFATFPFSLLVANRLSHGLLCCFLDTSVPLARFFGCQHLVLIGLATCKTIVLVDRFVFPRQPTQSRSFPHA